MKMFQYALLCLQCHKRSPSDADLLQLITRSIFWWLIFLCSEVDTWSTCWDCTGNTFGDCSITPVKLFSVTVLCLAFVQVGQLLCFDWSCFPFQDKLITPVDNIKLQLKSVAQMLQFFQSGKYLLTLNSLPQFSKLIIITSYMFLMFKYSVLRMLCHIRAFSVECNLAALQKNPVAQGPGKVCKATLTAVLAFFGLQFIHWLKSCLHTSSLVNRRTGVSYWLKGETVTSCMVGKITAWMVLNYIADHQGLKRYYCFVQW